VVATVVALDDAGRGVVQVDGEPVAVEGALSGERVICRPRKRRRQGHQADLVEVLEAADERVEPVCPHFHMCGGCRLQHMPAHGQIALKQQNVLRALARHGHLEPDAVPAPLTGPSTAYRRRARLGVKYVPGKGGVLVGFREKNGAKLAELGACAILESRVGDAIEDIRTTLDKLEIRHRIPQLEVAMGDTGTALILRHLDPLSPGDRDLLVEFASRRDWQLYLQPGGPDSVHALWPAEPPALVYALPDFDLELAFRPTDFIQINAAVNHALVRTAMDSLDLHADSRVLDLYCGIGNFTLAAARRAATVTGVEGDAGLVSRALGNARRNHMNNVSFVCADLNRVHGTSDWWQQEWHRLLLDPPRSGASEVLNALGDRLPPRIVYVSCNPETLARDAGLLVHGKGYRLHSVRIVDMFPHTTHCEVIAVFGR
jgi:23S rRNA (uracil1939-C5)-methyltransferase